ncbi:MAG: hypothetical protein HYV09_33030 [Deltaproteobacteria bacterium]|nr:hypothetical protein [Deltaproteobacteria bacterium]
MRLAAPLIAVVLGLGCASSSSPSAADAGPCPAGQFLGYFNAGCSEAPRCVGPGDAVAVAYCSCQGKTISGWSDHAGAPWVSRGPCADADAAARPPACSPTITFEGVAAESSACVYWVEATEFASCGVAEISKATPMGFEVLTFDLVTRSLVRHTRSTDVSSDVLCSSAPAHTCATPTSCNTLCFTRDHGVEMPLPRCSAADAGSSEAG